MSASQKAKDAGLKSLQEAAEICGRKADLLNIWEKKYPDLFEVVISGCVAKKSNLDFLKKKLELLELIKEVEDEKNKLAKSE